MPIITLTSDFGTKDPYVACMKAVILSICPEAMIIDISHEVEKFNIRVGSFILASVARYFPEGTIHVAIVDPGVGTERRSIIIKGRKHYYVGPDNGVLILASSMEGIESVYEIKERKYMLPEISATFHGRDIFAPVAAYLAKGVKPEEIGPAIEDYVKPSFASPVANKHMLHGEVIYIDSFGNIISNIPSDMLKKFGIREGDWIEISLDEKIAKMKFCRAYGHVKVGSLLAIIGSSGFMEISVNQGNAASMLKARVGDKLTIRYPSLS